MRTPASIVIPEDKLLRVIPLLLSLFLVLGSPLLTGCRPKTATPGPQTYEGPVGDPVEGDWIVERFGGEPPHLNPYLETGGAEIVLITSGHIFETLLDRNQESLELEGLLAESFHESDDHLTYTFKLREDVTFSDGVPMTAADVKFSFDAVLNPENDTADVRSYFTNVESITQLDDYTIEIKCHTPYFKHMETFGSSWVYPKHIYGESNFNTHPANSRPVGSGPFVFDSWNTGQQLTLVKRKDYWRDEKKPYVDRLMYKFISDENAAFQVLQQQQVDVMRVRSAEKWLKDAATPAFENKFHKFELYSPENGYMGTFGWIGWNMRRPQFQDKRVRQALTLLMDRQTILERIYLGQGRVVSGFFFPDSPEYDATIAPWPYDPQRAMQLLEEAGWVDTNNNGIRDKDGVEFRYEWMYPSGPAEYDRMATVYKEQLQRAGIEVTLRPLEWGTFLDSVTKRNFDSIMMAWVSPVESDPYQIWHSSQVDRGSNYVGFNIPEADEIIAAARVEFDRDKRIQLYRRLHAILHEEQPYTFLFNTKRKIAIDKRFQNVKEYPLGFNTYEWWVPAQWQRYGTDAR